MYLDAQTHMYRKERKKDLQEVFVLFVFVLFSDTWSQ